MLRSFRVANHKSIRDEVELLLLPAYEKSRPVVPVAAIFGANASGKSNIVDALRFMWTAVRRSYGRWEAETGVPRTPFRLASTGLVEPSTYAVDILVDEVKYVYGFSVDDDRVVEEWLHRYPHGKKAVIFERDGQAIELGSTVPERQSRTRLLESLTRDNALLLSAAVQAQQVEVQPVYRWFQKDLRFLRFRGGPQPIDTGRIELALNRHGALVELLRAADFGIADVRVERVEAALSELELAEAELIEGELETLRQMMDDVPDEEQPGVARQIRRMETLARRRTRAGVRTQLIFAHGPDGVLLGEGEQSDGTMAWLSLLAEGLDALDIGGVLVVDEIDASLHPRLTARLIELFRSDQTNRNRAQLIFTTHDATLLGTSFGRDVLARDEVWFVEKDAKGATSLFPLTDFHPRKEENTERRYLGGSYGAVPGGFSDTLVERLTELQQETRDASS